MWKGEQHSAGILNELDGSPCGRDMRTVGMGESFGCPSDSILCCPVRAGGCETKMKCYRD